MIKRISTNSKKCLSSFVALDHLVQFQDSCSSTNLPALKTLHFSLCFPHEIEHKWRMSAFDCNRQWPFDDVHWYIDERWISQDGDYRNMTRTFFIVYRCPINILLQHSRNLHNHRLALQTSLPIRTSQRQHLKWTCDEVNTPEKIFNTLQILASSHLNKLSFRYLTKQVRTRILGRENE